MNCIICLAYDSVRSAFAGKRTLCHIIFMDAIVGITRLADHAWQRWPSWRSYDDRAEDIINLVVDRVDSTVESLDKVDHIVDRVRSGLGHRARPRNIGDNEVSQFSFFEFVVNLYSSLQWNKLRVEVRCKGLSRTAQVAKIALDFNWPVLGQSVPNPPINCVAVTVERVELILMLTRLKIADKMGCAYSWQSQPQH